MAHSVGDDDPHTIAQRRADALAAPDLVAEPDPPVQTPPALLLGGPLIPAPLLAELIAAGATVRPVRHPGPHSAPEPGYRPPTAPDGFVRCRA